jgi:hypothetical protein
MDYQVTRIIPDGNDPGRRIDAIWGPDFGLKYEDEAIREIDAGVNSYYTLAYGLYRADVCVAHNAYGTRFLTTDPDGIKVNNLCQLPRFIG